MTSDVAAIQLAFAQCHAERDREARTSMNQRRVHHPLLQCAEQLCDVARREVQRTKKKIKLTVPPDARIIVNGQNTKQSLSV